MIIGITGYYCAGKDTAAEYLVRKKNFIHRSLSDVLREEVIKRGKQPTRVNLLEMGIELRAKRGYGVLAEIVIEGMDKTKDYVITSIRHPDEIRRLSLEKNFILLNLEAPQVVRFERLLKRARPGDPATFEDFTALEKKEASSEGPQQQLGKCAELADINIDNSINDFETLYRKIDEVLNNLK